MSWKDRIEIEPKILAGKPIVVGTRLSVDFLLGLFAQGWSKADVLRSYPQLREEDLHAVFAYSAARLKDEMLITNDGSHI